MNRPASLVVSLAVVVVWLLPTLSAQDAPQDRAAVLARLAAIQLQVEVDRDFDGAEAALAALDTKLAGTAQAALLSDPEAAALRAQIRAAIDAARRDDGPDLEQSVADAIVNQDEITLTTLGTRAAAVLRHSLESGTGPLADINDSLRIDWLLRLDEPAGWEFLERNPLRLGPDSANYVLDSVRLHGLRWTSYPGRAPVLNRPEWLDWAARLLETPSALTALADRREHINSLSYFLQVLSERDLFTPRLTDALSSLLARTDGYSAITLIQTIENGPWAPSAQRVLETLVLDERLAVRTEAAKALLNADISPGLRGRVDDPDVGMRLLVLQSLLPRSRNIVQWPERDGSANRGSEGVPQAKDDEARALLTRLAADVEPAVREAVIGGLRTLETPLADDVYRRLAEDSDVQVRQAMVKFVHPDLALQTELHVTLARDSEPRVVAEVDKLLAYGDWDKQSGWLAPVLRARLRNQTVPLTTSNALPRIFNVAPAVRELTRAWLDSGVEQALPLLLKSSVDSQGRFQGQSAVDEWKKLAGPELVRLLPALYAAVPDAVYRVTYAANTHPGDPGWPDALESIARDAQQPVLLRLAACKFVMLAPSAERQSLLVGLLADPAFSEGTPDDSTDETLLVNVIEATPASSRNGVLRDILEHVALRRRLMSRVVNAVTNEGPEAGPTARLIADRFMDDDMNFDSVEKAIVVLGYHPELVDEDLMHRALHARYVHAWSAVAVLSRLRDARFLGLLAECLDPTWLPDTGSIGSEPSDMAVKAVDALHGYMSDEAAAILLDAAANSPRAKVRDAALEAVEAISRYRDALAAWQRRKSVGDTRDEAVGRLVAMYTDSTQSHEVRVEALRALGTLGAVEYMPLIIEALGSAEKDMRDAAREALQKLNAPPPAPAAIPASPAPVEPTKSDS